MPEFEIDDKEFWKNLSVRDFPDWVKKSVHQKIEEIKINPKGSGGFYRGKYSYSSGEYKLLNLMRSAELLSFSI